MAFERWRRLGLLLTLTAPAALGCGSSGASKESAPDGGGSGSPDGSSSGVGDAMHAGDSPSTNDAGGGDASGPTTPTVSSWVGTNVDADLPYADVTYMLGAFNTAAAQLDANGYPVAGASGQSQTDLGFQLPTGTYDISYVGAGTLAVSGIGALMGAWQTVNGEQREHDRHHRHARELRQLPHPRRHQRRVADRHGHPHPTSPASTTTRPTRLTRRSSRPSRPSARCASWAGWRRTTARSPTGPTAPRRRTSGRRPTGVPYELIAELANETGKDTWINVPEPPRPRSSRRSPRSWRTNLDFTRIAAARQAAGFTTPFQLILENSNETWNTGFTRVQHLPHRREREPDALPGHLHRHATVRRGCRATPT